MHWKAARNATFKLILVAAGIVVAGAAIKWCVANELWWLPMVLASLPLVALIWMSFYSVAVQRERDDGR